jgi:hypothetical protein
MPAGHAHALSRGQLHARRLIRNVRPRFTGIVAHTHVACEAACSSVYIIILRIYMRSLFVMANGMGGAKFS